MSNNDPLNRECGGNHYQQFAIQPIELTVACKWDFIQGNIAKYLLRAKYKNGQQDIDKAVHYCELGRTLQDDDLCIDNTAIIHSFIRINGLNEDFWSKVFYMINKKNYFSLFAELIRKENVEKYLL